MTIILESNKEIHSKIKGNLFFIEIEFNVGGMLV